MFVEWINRVLNVSVCRNVPTLNQSRKIYKIRNQRERRVYIITCSIKLIEIFISEESLAVNKKVCQTRKKNHPDQKVGPSTKIG